jgi:hypothetical protein
MSARPGPGGGRSAMIVPTEDLVPVKKVIRISPHLIEASC